MRRDTIERKVTILATDQTLRCRECGRDFVFTAGEQEFYASKGLMNTPSRCPECRAARKSSMSGGSYGGERAPRQMYTANCSSCGGEARVPSSRAATSPSTAATASSRSVAALVVAVAAATVHAGSLTHTLRVWRTESAAQAPGLLRVRALSLVMCSCSRRSGWWFER
ncbi:MAG TPA: zinc-ribbon domain containing protein [Ktedonobacterales bacterium]